MRRLRIAFRTIIFLILFAFFHYLLPQHDVARVTSTEVIRADFSWYNRMFYAQADSGAAELSNRDLRLINTVRKRSFLLGFIPRDAERVMVFRNEDTGWIWPPYFKFDSSDLQAEAAAVVSTAAEPQWVVITHYGWRNRFFTVFPNAVGIRPIEGPNVYPIPWFNIFFFIFLVFGWALARAMWRQFRERKIDPVLEDVSDAAARVGDEVADRRGRISQWLDTWRSKPRR
ncbi:hypothetical protein AIOL_000479 [Candidatus Rhodobacter oscarellae]|uniref:DUF1523 domain-containing protein n=1 Tax=Candidatus Rhodobacter oscarellae TaxID=1675527 RepID=A0A0J9ECF3_9RHOB|nr:DUF1523 family protein [Candidatus Rhodobacter lobularis]KMW60326.1 hypothetical protein AIOL_000479 [Candidatus Rhodobacter lobularis]